jgi:hypothetical protein
MCLLAPISALDLPNLRTGFPLLWNVQISDECCDAQNKGIDGHFFCKSSYFFQSREDCNAQKRALVKNLECYLALVMKTAWRPRPAKNQRTGYFRSFSRLEL